MSNGTEQLKWFRGAVAIVAVAAISGAATPAQASAFAPTIRSGVLHPQRLSSVAWEGGRKVTRSGEQVTVFVSPAYASDPGTAQRWAEFFASLLHGSELGLLTAYVAPFDEVQELCHSNGEVAGCYWAQKLVMVGDPIGDLQPSSVATHEYGHHVANNRSDAPWLAIDWGTKRWASAMNVCARVEARTAFPGDEGLAYDLNPGEAFAESYRVLNETQTGLPFSWPILDPSFIPDPAALQAVRDDVLQPWTAPGTRTIRARFAHGRRAWTLKLATPLDGELSVRLTQGPDELDLVGGARTVLAHGSWAPGGGKSLAYRICGQRSLTIRVRTDRGGPRAFTLKVTQP